MKAHSLPVLMPAIADQRWSCHSCGDCCRSLVGHLTPAERKRIQEQGWADELGAAPMVRGGRSWVLNKRPDGACVFLDDQNRCRIHARFGEAAKPLACRIFPFSVRAIRTGWQASLRFDCPSVTSSKGQPLGQHRPFLTQLVGELDHDVRPRDHVVRLQRGLVASEDELAELLRHIRTWLDDSTFTSTQRLIGAARLTGMLTGAKLKNVRGERFRDLLDVLFETLPGEVAALSDAPTPKQCGMLRQLAFAHAEHVTLAELRSGIVGRMRERWTQLRSAKRFLKGEGAVPTVPGLPHGVTFESVERVGGAVEDAVQIEELVRRYLTARLAGGAAFGGGYYGWSVVDGLAALWASVAATGWLARHAAAAQRRERLTFADAAAALGVVDRAATRLPALGTWTERARLTYLMADDGLSRLVRRYALVEAT